MTLHTVGPASMAEDERVIGKNYQTWMVPIYGATPFVVASFADAKWVTAAGFAAALAMLHEIGCRLHDLCIRVRRTNLLLNEGRRPPAGAA